MNTKEKNQIKSLRVNMKKKKSDLQQIAEELANLSPAEIEVLRFACDHDNPVVSKRRM